MLMAADSITDGDLHISSFGIALLVALVASAVSLVIAAAALVVAALALRRRPTGTGR